jgi:hypothetical protein
MKSWKAEPTSIKDILIRDGLHIAKELERCRNQNRIRAYNKILKDLRRQYPQYTDEINSLMLVRKPVPEGMFEV